MASLQDQLLKAGLVDAKQAKQASKDKRKADKVQRKSGTPQVNETQEAAARARAEKQARDRELNEARDEKAMKKAVAAQIKQLIELNRVDKGRGEGLVGYHFTHGKQIKKIFVKPDVQLRLERGVLAIVKLGEDYDLVPAPVAAKIAERNDQYVIAVQAATQAVEEDDPYADYQIPDDLMW